MTVLAEGFAGDDSMLVETKNPSGRRLHVIVREGGVLSEIDVEPTDEAYIRALGRQAAQHICSLANSC